MLNPQFELSLDVNMIAFFIFGVRNTAVVFDINRIQDPVQIVIQMPEQDDLPRHVSVELLAERYDFPIDVGRPQEMDENYRHETRPRFPPIARIQGGQW